MREDIMRSDLNFELAQKSQNELKTQRFTLKLFITIGCLIILTLSLILIILKRNSKIREFEIFTIQFKNDIEELNKNYTLMKTQVTHYRQS